MTVRLTNVFNDREVEIQGDHSKLTGSVFIEDKGHGFCIEVDKAAFIAAIKEEFGLLEPLEVGIERFFAAA